MAFLRKTGTIAAVALGVIAWSGWSLSEAQDPKGDDALDRLLEQAQGQKEPGGRARQTKPAGESKETDSKAPAKVDGNKPKPKREVEDKALDDLLEKLGQSDDTPQTKGRPQPPATPSDDPVKAKSAQRPDDPSAERFDPQKKQLDEHLEDLLGRKRRRNQDQGKEDPSAGPLAEAIKKMREVEKRLDESDTGEQTRKKQEEIVKDLEQLIKIARQMKSGQGRQRGNPQAGQRQPGDDQNNPNNPQQGIGLVRPKKPTAESVLRDDKGLWGHLPPELRGEMENVFKEEALPGRKTLIDRYYLSVNRKSMGNRPDGSP